MCGASAHISLQALRTGSTHPLIQSHTPPKKELCLGLTLVLGFPQKTSCSSESATALAVPTGYSDLSVLRCYLF